MAGIRRDIQQSINFCQNLVEKRMKDCVARICETGKEMHLQKGAILPANLACWLESGRCVLSLDDLRGDSISLFYFKPGRLVNFLPLLVKSFPQDAQLLKRKVPSAYFHVKTLEDCKLYIINEAWFLEEFGNKPELPCLFLYSTMLNLIHAYMSIWNAPILSNTQRICRLLLASLEDNDTRIPPHLTQAEISRHLSIHSITVAKIFGKLRKMGVLAKKSQCLIIGDMKLLQSLAEGRAKIIY